MLLLRYLTHLSGARLVLWCYLLWYVVFLVLYFDPNPQLWLSSVGISAIIGVALVLSTRSSSRGPVALDRWQVLRLFLMPFCVSSFAALIKGQGFVLVFSPKLRENALAAALCLAFCAGTAAVKARARARAARQRRADA